MNKQLIISRIDIAMLFLCGFIVFSPISSNITLDFLNLPLALPELLFLPFYFKISKIFNLKVNSKILVTGSVIIILLIAIAFIFNLFPFSSILSTARGYFYMLLVFSIFKNKPISDINYIFYVAFGSSVAWMILGLYSINQLITNFYSEWFTVIYGNMIALSLMITIAIVYSKRYYIYITYVITLSISLTVGLRRQLLASILAYILSFFSLMQFSSKRIVNLFILISIISISVVFVYPAAQKFIYEASPQLYMRLFLKSENILTGTTNISDESRLNSLNGFIENIDNYIIPRGFVSKRTMEDKGAGLFMDAPYIELFHTFGIIFLIPILLYFFSSLKFHYRNFYRRGIKESAVCIVMGGVIFSLLLVEGSFLNFVYTTPITGYVLARIFSTKNLIMN